MPDNKLTSKENETESEISVLNNMQIVDEL